MTDAVRSGRASVPSILIFIAADTASFILFFAVFMSERAKQVEVFARSAGTLDVRLGLINTLILITSGWLVALAVSAAKRNDLAKVRLRLLLAIGIGFCFGVVKIVEYSQKLNDGITPLTNAFYTYYFVLTGVHFLHFVIGIILLLIILNMSKSTTPKAQYMTWLESGALYWHMVDLLWIFLFPMLYLQGQR
ncbi:MAG: heme/copper-type cytochrome/quinol oxidase, subunit 3 [Sphingomonadales bacterium]|nr:heme/copper-type cytochrome/quinol oxidase, subunit 3 [Sphingomonadales bacterium]